MDCRPAGNVTMTRLFVAPQILLVLVLMSAACSGSTQPSHTPLDQPFDLRAGSSAVVDGGLRVTFERVPADSRCPLDALCIRGGDATVAITVSQDGRNAAARELRTDPVTASITSYDGYSIRLVSLGPYPRSDRPILADDYVATLTVAAR
jgi:hypothetical protein